MEYPYLLLDAGGTLVFPDQELICQVLAARGCALDSERVYEAHFKLVKGYDEQTRKTSIPVTVSIHSFYVDMMRLAGASPEAAEAVVGELAARHEKVSLWTYTKPWVSVALETLKSRGIRMSVISNSDGRVYSQLEACGVTPYMEAVFDSEIVGVEKPDPRLFRHALDKLGLAAEECLYVGDNYCIDVVGANRAGIGAVHLDPLNCYQDWPGVHIRDIRELPVLMDDLRENRERFDLYPARNL
jgi:putative hydrolase of the HAD superfamily